MDIYTYLKKDHKKVADLMDQVLASKNPNERKELFDTIKTELTLHADSEEATFYKAIEDATRSKSVHEQMDHADEEHAEIRDYLETLETIDITTEEWIEQFGEFKHSVTHHVHEEEGDIFEKAKKYLTDKQVKDLAAEMDALKKEMQKDAQYAA